MRPRPPADRSGAVPRRIGVVVPAKNEASSLPDCLAALVRAALEVPIPVHVVVVLDACTDDSAESLAAARATLTRELNDRVRLDAVSVELSNVGAARAAGVQHLLQRYAPEQLWLANTDADSCVPACWLTSQLAHARAGADALAGTVTVADWGDRPPAVIARARAEYLSRSTLGAGPESGGHGHVHAANLGVSAEAYLAAGGFPAMSVHEDVALINALRAHGRLIVWADDIPVQTSARRHARTAGGFAGYLNALEGEATMATASTPAVQSAPPIVLSTPRTTAHTASTVAADS